LNQIPDNEITLRNEERGDFWPVSIPWKEDEMPVFPPSHEGFKKRLKSRYPGQRVSLSYSGNKGFCLPIVYIDEVMEVSMRKRKSISGILSVTFFLSCGALLIFGQAPARNLEKTEGLRREIRLINLLNGLDLTPEQMTLIKEKAEASRRP